MSLRPTLVAFAFVGMLTLGACVSAAPASPPPAVAPTHDQGNIDSTFPELTLEQNADGSLHVSVTDPAAKAWRVVVAGEGALAEDQLEIVVETGDVQASVIVRETVAGTVIDEVELTGLDGAPTAVAGGCHHTLPVCYSSADLALPGSGDPTFGVDLELLDPAAPLVITGGSADWVEEPFVLGPWREAEPFTTGQ